MTTHFIFIFFMFKTLTQYKLKIFEKYFYLLKFLNYFITFILKLAL